MERFEPRILKLQRRNQLRGRLRFYWETNSAGFYRGDALPMIGTTGPVPPPRPVELPGSTPTTPAHPPRPSISTLPSLKKHCRGICRLQSNAVMSNSCCELEL